MCSHCDQGGWNLGNTINGTQAEHVRIPFADTSMHHIPAEAELESMVLLSDILPTAITTRLVDTVTTPMLLKTIVSARLQP